MDLKYSRNVHHDESNFIGKVFSVRKSTKMSKNPFALLLILASLVIIVKLEYGGFRRDTRNDKFLRLEEIDVVGRSSSSNSSNNNQKQLYRALIDIKQLPLVLNNTETSIAKYDQRNESVRNTALNKLSRKHHHAESHSGVYENKLTSIARRRKNSFIHSFV